MCPILGAQGANIDKKLSMFLWDTDAHRKTQSYYSSRPPTPQKLWGETAVLPQDWRGGGATARLLKLFSLRA